MEHKKTPSTFLQAVVNANRNEGLLGFGLFDSEVQGAALPFYFIFSRYLSHALLPWDIVPVLRFLGKCGGFSVK